MSGYAVLISTYGGQEWADLARERAEPSAHGQGATVIVMNHDSDGTLASSRNRAARRSAGQHADWLCFLDADDELAPGYLNAISTAIGPRLRSGTGLLGETGLLGLYSPLVSYNGGPPHVPNAGRWPRLNEHVIGTVIHRSLFERVGGFREYPIYEDWDLWLRCVRVGAFRLHVPGAVYRATVRGGSRNDGPGAQATYDQIWADYEAAA